MKKKLHESFSMKEFKNAMYILRIWIEQHRSQKIRRLLQTKYVQKVLWSFNMTNFRLTRTTLLMLTQLRRTPSTAEEKEHMKGYPTHKLWSHRWISKKHTGKLSSTYYSTFVALGIWCWHMVQTRSMYQKAIPTPNMLEIWTFGSLPHTTCLCTHVEWYPGDQIFKTIWLRLLRKLIT